MKQKQKQKQMQVVNVTVNAAEKKPVRRRAPRAKKPAAGDSVMLHRGDIPDPYPLPRPYPGYAPIGEPLRLAGPGQNYASLPAPLQRSNYASAPNVMNPQASASFVSAAGDTLYGRNRNKNDDVRQIVNPSDVKPMLQPSTRMSPSAPPPGAGYMPSAPPRDEDRSMKPPMFQGEVPRLNAPDESPSMRVIPSAPSASAVLQSNMSYPGFPFDEEREEMVSEEEDAAGASAAASAFEPADRRVVKRPTNVNVGGEASGISRPPYSPPVTAGVDLMANPYTEQSDDVLLKMASNLGIINAKKKFAGIGFRARLRAAIAEIQQGMSGSKEPAMRRGGSVF